VVKEMFADPKLEKKINLKFVPKFDATGERIYGNFESGLYFEYLQSKIPINTTPLTNHFIFGWHCGAKIWKPIVSSCLLGPRQLGC